MASGYRVLKGTKPMKLPDSIGVMDLTIVKNRDSASEEEILIDKDPLLGGDGSIDDAFELTDTTTFSVVFSPTGKLVTQRVQVRNRDGVADTNYEMTRGNRSDDDVFNKKGDVDKTSSVLVSMGMGREKGMFYQDDYYGGLDTPAYPDVPPDPDLGLGPEYSRTRFLIYNRTEFKGAYERRTAWSDYLIRLVGETTYINPHTGTIILRN